MENPHQALRQTLDQVQAFLLKINDLDATQKPAPGKWSKKEIIGHLIDSAGNNHQKFVRMMLVPGGHLDFVGYAQDDWVAIQNYQSDNWADLLAVWRSANLHIAHVMENCPPGALGNTISIDGVGPFRLDFIMADYVEHLKHHLKAVIPEANLTSRFGDVYHSSPN